MALEAATYGIRCDCSGCLCGSVAPPSPPPVPSLPPAPPLPPPTSPNPPLVATELVTFAELRRQLAVAPPGSTLAFTLAPGEVLEIEQSLVIAGISVSISSVSPGATIRRAGWANNSRVFEVRDAGHLYLSRVSVANGRTSNGEHGGGILVEGPGSILTAEFLAVSDCQVLDAGGPSWVSHLGGGIAAIAGAELRLHGVQVERCLANSGGGIAVFGSLGMLTDCRIADCTSNPRSDKQNGGAGIYITYRSIVSWRGGHIVNCSAVGVGAGAGVAAADSTFHMMNAAISGCEANFGGAGFIVSRLLGDPTALSIGNLTNVSVSNW